MKFVYFLTIPVLSLAFLQEPQNTFDILYNRGKLAYNNENWTDCVTLIRKSVKDFQYYRNGLVYCRENCKNTDESYGFDYFIEKSLCLEKCKKDFFGLRPDKIIDIDTLMDFTTMEPYRYLQYCHWKLGHLEPAVSAAYTFLIKNPNDEIMTEWMQFYENERNYDTAMLKDELQKPYQPLFNKAKEHFDQNEFQGAIEKFTESLSEFYGHMEKCRLLCESSFDYGSLLDRAPEMYTLIARLYKTVLQCKVGCENRLSMINGNYVDDFVASHFSYLQECYYNIGDSKKAAEALASYLLFIPDDEFMLNIKIYYETNLNVNEQDFIPNKEAVDYYEKGVLENKQWEYVMDKFLIEEKKEIIQTCACEPSKQEDSCEMIKENNENHEVLEEKSPSIKRQLLQPPIVNGPMGYADWSSLSRDRLSTRKRQRRWTPPEKKLMKFEIEKGVRIVKKEEELNGTFRFLAENVLSKSECELLMKLKFTELGDGYGGKKFPHTRNEYFSGLSMTRLSELSSNRQLPYDTAKLVFDKTELARDLTETYFNLTNLYFGYTHLACREAIQDTNSDRSGELSHAFHGDNCILEGSVCIKKKPAYTWRDYSFIIYLNNDFEGGEFIFGDFDKNIQAEIKPVCGQMVGFTGETLHGVKALTKGTRCVLAVWATLDSTHEEKARIVV